MAISSFFQRYSEAFLKIAESWKWDYFINPFFESEKNQVQPVYLDQTYLQEL